MKFAHFFKFAAPLGTASLLLLASSVSFADPSEDAREPAAFNALERAYILGQMRLFVESIQVISASLASDHLSDVVEAAAARGKRRNANDPNYPKSINAHATALWKQMGGSVRRGFDELADAAQNGAPKEQQLAILAETMKNCVACHQTYRIVDAPEP
jgi:cytochrome c556